MRSRLLSRRLDQNNLYVKFLPLLRHFRFEFSNKVFESRLVQIRGYSDHKIMKKNIFCVKLIALLLLTGCAHLASNPAACEAADPLLPLPFSFLGNVFQISPCTSIEPLRIEIGVELKDIRSSVETAIKQNQINSSIEKYSQKMGCGADSLNLFFELLTENKEEVFGKNFENSNRAVVKKTREFTKQDPILKTSCWGNNKL